ncbi:MAG: HD-GYP domain-containing protein [Lachnospiraceae bacterium]|nr:HD-GYP domain-containing protein [Lachnospiraceae bacterium]
MSRVDNLKKIIKRLTGALLAFLALLIVIFIIHCINVGRYNSEWRIITSDSSSTQILVDVHPRGGVTDSWVKTNTGLGTSLNAKIYEMVVTNNSHYYVDDWQIRFNVTDKCYLNNGWCGTFEIHQFDRAGTETSQTLDLRNFDNRDIYLFNYLAGQDLLIPLDYGDYFIYHPDTSPASGEVPIKGSEDMSGSSVCGIIMYSLTGEVNLLDYELSYKLHRGLWDGTTGRFLIISFTLLALSFIILGTIFLVSVRFESRIISQNKLLADAFRICCAMPDSRDYYSKGHSERVANIARLIAEKMGMDKSDCEIVYNAALFHNVGMVTVNEQILRKKGKLTREEYAEVKKHTIRGAELLKDIENIPHAEEAALYHHERYDGTGYPFGKKEDEIPLIGRIVAVADAYDAMNNDRPYRSKFSRDQIREEFIKNRGTQFDPAIVTAFLDVMGERNL